ncbi:hypothetical protein C8J57DRAFT_1720364 [Mycena rebaudengoi]|nr:hypothetical protein C8J57DRAFT_1720364 [Mycena rebaudengoi]
MFSHPRCLWLAPSPTDERSASLAGCLDFAPLPTDSLTNARRRSVSTRSVLYSPLLRCRILSCLDFAPPDLTRGPVLVFLLPYGTTGSSACAFAHQVPTSAARAGHLERTCARLACAGIAGAGLVDVRIRRRARLPSTRLGQRDLLRFSLPTDTRDSNRPHPPFLRAAPVFCCPPASRASGARAIRYACLRPTPTALICFVTLRYRGLQTPVWAADARRFRDSCAPRRGLANPRVVLHSPLSFPTGAREPVPPTPVFHLARACAPSDRHGPPAGPRALTHTRTRKNPYPWSRYLIAGGGSQTGTDGSTKILESDPYPYPDRPVPGALRLSFLGYPPVSRVRAPRDVQTCGYDERAVTRADLAVVPLVDAPLLPGASFLSQLAGLARAGMTIRTRGRRHGRGLIAAAGLWTCVRVRVEMCAAGGARFTISRSAACA